MLDCAAALKQNFSRSSDAARTSHLRIRRAWRRITTTSKRSCSSCKAGGSSAPRTQFTCFTSSLVQILTQAEADARVARKRWRLYAPHITLAQSYSSDYARKQLGAPVLDVVLEAGDKIIFFGERERERERERDVYIYVYIIIISLYVLEAGDLLYMPRGTIHEATTALLRCQHLYFCTGKASKLSTSAWHAAPPQRCTPPLRKFQHTSHSPPTSTSLGPTCLRARCLMPSRAPLRSICTCGAACLSAPSDT